MVPSGPKLQSLLRGRIDGPIDVYTAHYVSASVGLRRPKTRSHEISLTSSAISYDSLSENRNLSSNRLETSWRSSMRLLLHPPNLLPYAPRYLSENLRLNPNPNLKRRKRMMKGRLRQSKLVRRYPLSLIDIQLDPPTFIICHQRLSQHWRFLLNTTNFTFLPSLQLASPCHALPLH